MPLHDLSAQPVGNVHACRVTRASGNFSVGNNILTAVAFTAEDYDTDNMHDNSTNNTRITIPVISGVATGLWSVAAGGYTDAATGRIDCEIRLNGTTVIALSLVAFSASGATSYFSGCHYIFSAGDYIECLVRTTGASQSVIFDPPSPNFEAHFVGKVT